MHSRPFHVVWIDSKLQTKQRVMVYSQGGSRFPESLLIYIGRGDGVLYLPRDNCEPCCKELSLCRWFGEWEGHTAKTGPSSSTWSILCEFRMAVDKGHCVECLMNICLFFEVCCEELVEPFKRAGSATASWGPMNARAFKVASNVLE